METKHTPGPWFVGHRVNAAGDVTRDMTTVCDSNNRVICEVWFNANVPQATANARLIAAAPELLAYAECEKALWAADDKEDYESTLRQHGWDGAEPSGLFMRRMRDAAIAKATGGQS